MDEGIRELTMDEAESAAMVHRTAFDESLPWLKGLHTKSEDTDFYRISVFRKCRVWGAFHHGELIAVMALRAGWIDQLYVLPQAQSQGIGSALLALAKSSQRRISLWTFQKNQPARRFYERHGFIVVEQTDGSTNEEREPDVRYEWTRS